MQQFEKDYAALIVKVLSKGTKRATRNGNTYSTFGEVLRIPVGFTDFPILQGRKMYPKGVFGEFAAIVRQPKSLSDFTDWGCNYWNLWAKEDGSLNVDYGNSWFDFNGVNQIAQLKDKLENNPTDRRMVVSGWKPDGMDDLDLPCCHMMYQFYVEKDTLHMTWTQRSVDVMIGLPSDIVFAATWLIALSREFGMQPGTITMMLGDCHVYEEHIVGAKEYVDNVEMGLIGKRPTYLYVKPVCEAFETFKPSDLVLSTYASYGKIDLELKA